MDNTNQCTKQGLLYNSFAIIQIQTFCTDGLLVDVDGRFVKKFDDAVDCQMFTNPLKFYTRYELEGFDVEIVVDKRNTLKGHVHVRAIKFFETCMQLSYRFVVVEGGKIDDKVFCEIHHAFNTNQLIAAAGLVQKVEYWDVDPRSGKQSIDGIVKKVTVSNIPLSSKSTYLESPTNEELDSLDEVMYRYRHYFDKAYSIHNKDLGLIHTFIDVCDNIEHNGGIDFTYFKEASIIEHIETHHKSELVGLMSLYPKEWPYRMDSSYNDICGRNIAIDTDDLVLTNQNMSLVIGTYGKRGNEEELDIDEEEEEEGVDWKKHLKRRDMYHVCWPEYLILIELILAKKQTINYAITRYIQKSKDVSDQNTRKRIEENAKLSIELSNSILELDSIRYLRYVAHKHMFKLAEQNLDVQDDEQYLNETISRIDNSLNNANNSIELSQAERSNHILFLISVATLVGAGLQIIVPTMLSEKSIWLVLAVSAVTLIVTVRLLVFIFTYRKKKKK